MFEQDEISAPLTESLVFLEELYDMKRRIGRTVSAGLLLFL